MERARRTLLALAALACAAGAQSPQALVLEGDVLPGGAHVTGVRYVHVDDFGGWLVEVSTDDPASPTAVLRDTPFWGVDGVWKQVGDRVLDPQGATVAEFDAFSAEAFGGIIWNARLDGVPAGEDQALYFEKLLWMQAGPIGTLPGTDWPPGSRWVSFDDARGSLETGYVLLRGRADDPGVPGDAESYVALGSLCGSIGLLCQVERVAQQGWPAPVLGDVIESIRLAPAAAAVATSAVRMIWSCDLEGPVGTDGCVFLSTSTTQHELLAREGMPSPVPGRRWGPLEAPGVHVNDAGSWTLRATLDASDPTDDELIVRSGQVLVREGGTLPAIAPDVFDGFGTGRALLDKSGQVHWYGRWDGPEPRGAGLFRDSQLLVRTGVTTIDGRTIVALHGGPDDLALTPAGDLLLFKATLEGGVEGAFALDL